VTRGLHASYHPCRSEDSTGCKIPAGSSLNFQTCMRCQLNIHLQAKDTIQTPIQPIIPFHKDAAAAAGNTHPIYLLSTRRVNRIHTFAFWYVGAVQFRTCWFKRYPQICGYRFSNARQHTTDVSCGQGVAHLIGCQFAHDQLQPIFAYWCIFAY
jgi:hypothetical protein